VVEDLDLLISAAEEAGDIALGYSGKIAKSWDKPDGAGPVTEADLAVNAMLKDRLTHARPGYGWISEETADNPERLTRERVFVIDPIDGTRGFAEGSRTWAHALAIVENGVPTTAVVYLPQRELMYVAKAGRGATLNGASIGASGVADPKDADILAARPISDGRHWRGSVPAFTRHYRPSLAYRTALVAQGLFDAIITLRRTWEWDVAAGDLILREAGAVSSDRDGLELRFNNPEPAVAGLVAGGPALHAALVAALDRP